MTVTNFTSTTVLALRNRRTAFVITTLLNESTEENDQASTGKGGGGGNMAFKYVRRSIVFFVGVPLPSASKTVLLCGL